MGGGEVSLRYIASLSIVGLNLALLAACSAGHCRKPSERNQELLRELKGEPPVAAKKSEKEEETTVWVYKYDGSLQCNIARAKSLKVMAKQLAGIPILAQEKRHDGLMHITVCGSPTGKANVYKINKEDLEKAQAVDFKVWSFK